MDPLRGLRIRRVLRATAEAERELVARAVRAVVLRRDGGRGLRWWRWRWQWRWWRRRELAPAGAVGTLELQSVLHNRWRPGRQSVGGRPSLRRTEFADRRQRRLRSARGSRTLIGRRVAFPRRGAGIGERDALAVQERDR